MRWTCLHTAVRSSRSERQAIDVRQAASDRSNHASEVTECVVQQFDGRDAPVSKTLASDRIVRRTDSGSVIALDLDNF